MTLPRGRVYVSFTVLTISSHEFYQQWSQYTQDSWGQKVEWVVHESMIDGSMLLNVKFLSKSPKIACIYDKYENGGKNDVLYVKNIK